MTIESRFMAAQIAFEEAEAAAKRAKEIRDQALAEVVAEGIDQVGPFRIVRSVRLKLNDDYKALDLEGAIKIQNAKADLKKREDAAIEKAKDAGFGIDITEYYTVRRQQRRE